MQPGVISPRPQLLTYPDSLGGGLPQLNALLDGHLDGLVPGPVRILAGDEYLPVPGWRQQPRDRQGVGERRRGRGVQEGDRLMS